ncbi:MAG: hypothetical protein ACOVLB_07920 [Candidatus Nanopelagicus sp.]
MKLSQLTAKPQLVMIVLDDAETIAEYKEAVEFHTWDRQPMDVFMKLASATGENAANIIEIVKNLILDEDGKPILTKDNMLPTHILMKAISKVTDMLGK